MIELRTPAEIEAMKPAGRFVAEVLATLRDETRVGTNLRLLRRAAAARWAAQRFRRAAQFSPKFVLRCPCIGYHKVE